MSNFYAIKEETLTALGDAVRGKTGDKYVMVDEPTMEPISVFTVEANAANNNAKSIRFDLQELCGDFYSKVKNVYVEFDYETDQEGGFYMYFEWFENKEATKVFDMTDIDNSNYAQHPASNSGTFILPKRAQCYGVRVCISSVAIQYNRSLKLNIKVWPCDNNNKFFELNKYTPLEMVEKINGLEIYSFEPIVLTGNQLYGCAGPIGSNYIKAYGNTISTKNITNTQNMFRDFTLEEIPFSINYSLNNAAMDNMFDSATNLKTLPKILEPRAYSFPYLFNNCRSLREIPDDYFDTWNWNAMENATSEYSYGINSVFNSCSSLRKIPMEIFKHTNPKIYYSYSGYYNGFNQCYALDELVDFPMIHKNSTWTSNAFYNTFQDNYRLKRFKYALQDDGTPYVVNWKNQTIDLGSRFVGYVQSLKYILNYNAGITADKEVKDDATYQALKNDPDWFSCDVNYSRYNHDSAVETINSLPDTSAYGTNTIKFKGAAGALTDGGAINTLTEEEIAVAAAKGWTVTLV